MIILAFAVIAVLGFVIYISIMNERMKKIPSMSFSDMLAYDTENNDEAVITVGIIKDGKSSYCVYGANSSLLDNEQHIYEIGSLSKTFTTSLLCKALDEGKVSLDDNAADYLGINTLEYTPTLRRLATHTSGYKPYYFESQMIANKFNGSAGNDFYNIPTDVIIHRVGSTNLEDRDYPFEYSNFGFSVLGNAVARACGGDWSEVMTEYIQNDLGLKHTYISDSKGDLSGYWSWHENDGYLPAGCLLSTIDDMLDYAKIQLECDPEYLALSHTPTAKITKVNERYKMMGINMDAVGLGWMIDEQNGFVWHNGGTSKFTSYLGFNSSNGTAVVILANLAPGERIDVTVLGSKLMQEIAQGE